MSYWHGVFGGLYLPHLRDAIWRTLAAAERELRAGEPLAVELLDSDGDGFEELWIHSDRFSAVVSPERGAAIEEYTLFGTEINYANALTRRREAYHELTDPGSGAPDEHGTGTPSSHASERGSGSNACRRSMPTIARCSSIAYFPVRFHWALTLAASMSRTPLGLAAGLRPTASIPGMPWKLSVARKRTEPARRDWSRNGSGSSRAEQLR